MNPTQTEQTEQAHDSLRKILLQGRILFNGMPLTGTELGLIVQQEQMLFGKSVAYDKIVASEKDKKKEKESEKPEPSKKK